jgi:hypothetical protein
VVGVGNVDQHTPSEQCELRSAVSNSGVTHSPQLLRDNKTQQSAEEVQPNIALRCAMSTQYVAVVVAAAVALASAAAPPAAAAVGGGCGIEVPMTRALRCRVRGRGHDLGVDGVDQHSFLGLSIRKNVRVPEKEPVVKRLRQPSADHHFHSMLFRFWTKKGLLTRTIPHTHTHTPHKTTQHWAERAWHPQPMSCNVTPHPSVSTRLV